MVLESDEDEDEGEDENEEEHILEDNSSSFDKSDGLVLGLIRIGAVKTMTLKRKNMGLVKYGKIYEVSNPYIEAVFRSCIDYNIKEKERKLCCRRRELQRKK